MMKLRTTLAFAGGLLLLAALTASMSGLVASNPRPVHAAPVPEGLTGEYVLLEKKDGTFTAMKGAKVRALAGESYLVGETVYLEGVTDDRLFTSTTQWARLSDVRRMGTLQHEGHLEHVKQVAEEMKVERRHRGE
jgi:hypothetical protein